MKMRIGMWILLVHSAFGQAPATGKVDFERQVEPVLAAKCYDCHGAQKQLAGLRLDRRQLALRGGDYGRVIIPGDSANSKLIHRVSGGTAGMQMPPAGPLEPQEIAILKAWIDQGPDYGNSQLASTRPAPRPASPALLALINTVVAQDPGAVRAAMVTEKTLATAVDGGGSTALMHAAGRGSKAVMEVLLQAGAPVNAQNRRGATALIWALADPAKVRMLLDHGADVSIKTREGKTALHVASQMPGFPETFRALLAKGADARVVDIAGNTPLHFAATAGSDAYIQALLDAGVPVNAMTGNGATPLFQAAVSGANGAVRLLLARGADPKIVTKKNISALAPAAYWGDVETMRLLIAKGAPVQLADYEGWTPLAHAAYSEIAGAEAVRLLLRNGAKSQKNIDGDTPETLAAKRGAAEVVRVLQSETDPQSELKRAIARAFAPLAKQSPNFIRIGGCNSCHNQDLPLFAQAIARERGVPAGGQITLAQETPDFERVFEHSGLLGASSIGYGVMGMTARRIPPNAKTDAMVNFLVAHQESDGRWASRSNRQPLSAGDHLATAFAIYVLRSYGRGARDKEVRRAMAWLQEHPPVTNQDSVMQVLGLAWGGAEQAVIAKPAAGLRSTQRASGGWAQLATLEPDAYATGQVLYALALAGVPSTDAAYRQGVAYLLRTQAADGTWHVKARSKPIQPYFESGFPYGHDQWISAAGTSWAAMALAMAVDVPTARAQR